MNKKKKKQTKKSESQGLVFRVHAQEIKLPFYIVKWRDHTAVSREWTHIEDIEVKVVEVMTSGWVVKEDDIAIVLAQNIGTNSMVGESMTILKSCIVEQTKL